MGDLNINYLDKNDHHDTKEIFTVNGFLQLLKSATRITENSSTLLDIILTNNPLNISIFKNIAAGLSDHNLTACVRKLNSIKYRPEIIICRDFSKYNIDIVSNELLNADWDKVYNSRSANIAYNCFKKILLYTLDRHAPTIEKTIKGKPSPWMNEKLKRHMNVRDQLLRKAQKSKRGSDWTNYRKKRNFVKNEVIRSKKSFFQSKLQENKNNPESFWKIVKNVFPNKTKLTLSSRTFKMGIQISNCKKLIAEEFCRYFSTVARTLKEKAFPLMNLTWKYKTPILYNVPKVKFREVSEIEVQKHLKNLKRKCATGLDNIPTRFLKETAHIISKPLTHVINISLTTGVFPEDLKLARVNPIYKSGSKHSFDNYRPISVLPALSKIFEKCVYHQLMTHLEDNNLLSENQFGFRRHRSTEHAITYFTDQIRKSMDKGQLTGAIFIDLQKAFDTISHGSIIDKLPSFGITETVQEWLTSYLFLRKQQVSYQGTMSTPCNILCGVPQGSILGPLLFLLCINDSIRSLTTCNMILYADDAVIYFSDKNIDVIQNHLERNFGSLMEWMTQNELIVNLKKGKTEIMVFGTNKRLNKLKEDPIKLEQNGTKINFTQHYKYLG